MKTLLVDDDPNFARGLELWLLSKGAEPCLAGGLEEAKTQLSQGGWDVILSDLHFPDGRLGFELAEALAKTGGQGGEGPPMFIFTGQPELETAIRAVGLRVHAYIPKPPDLDLLWGLIVEAVAESGRRRAMLDELAGARRLLAELAGEPALPEAARGQLTGLASAWAAADGGGLLFEQTLRETLRVLESTRRHFKSRELGQLRVRLEAIESALRAARGGGGRAFSGPPFRVMQDPP